MVWVRLEDTFPDHPKVAGLSDGAFRVFVEGLCYCNRHLTDGALPAPCRLPAGSKAGTFRRRANELVRAGLWTPDGAGWRVHDYEKYQPTRAQVLRQRELARDRKRRERGQVTHESRRDEHRESRRDKKPRHAVSHGGSHALPDPTPPLRGGGEGAHTHAGARAREAHGGASPRSLRDRMRALATELAERGLSREQALALMRARHPRHGYPTILKLEAWLEAVNGETEAYPALVLQAEADGFEVAS